MKIWRGSSTTSRTGSSGSSPASSRTSSSSATSSEPDPPRWGWHSRRSGSRQTGAGTSVSSGERCRRRSAAGFSMETPNSTGNWGAPGRSTICSGWESPDCSCSRSIDRRGPCPTREGGSITRSGVKMSPGMMSVTRNRSPSGCGRRCSSTAPHSREIAASKSRAKASRSPWNLPCLPSLALRDRPPTTMPPVIPGERAPACDPPRCPLSSPQPSIR